MALPVSRGAHPPAAESGRTRPPRPARAAASPWTRSTRTAGRRTARPPPAPPWPPRWPRARRRTGTPSSLRAQGLLSAHSRPQRSGAGTFWNQARAAGRPHPAGQPCPRGPGCWTGRRQAAPGARGSLTDSGYAFCRNRGPSRQEWILTRPPRRLLLTQGAGQRDLPRGPETVSPRGHDRKGGVGGEVGVGRITKGLQCCHLVATQDIAGKAESYNSCC